MTQPIPPWLVNQLTTPEVPPIADAPIVSPVAQAWQRANTPTPVVDPTVIQTPAVRMLSGAMNRAAPVAPIAQPSAMDQAIIAAGGGQAAPTRFVQPETTAPPQSGVPAPQAAEQAFDPGNENIANLARSYVAGSQAVAPAGISKTAEQWTQSGFGPTPDDRGEYAAAESDRQEAENEALLDARMRMMEQADRQDQLAQMEMLRGRGFANRLEELDQDKQARRAAVDGEVAKLEDLLEQQSRVSRENPVQKYFRDQGAWGRIVNGLSVGLGAMGQALAGGQNAALEMLNKEIDAAIAQQRNAVDTLGLQITGRRTILGEMLQKFLDPVAAENAARYAMSGIAESNWRMQAAREKSDALRAQMTSVADELAMQRAALKQQTLGAEHQKRWNWRPATVVGNPGGIQGLKRMLSDLGYKEGTPAYQQAMTAAVSGGPTGMAERLQALADKQQGPADRNEVAVAEFMLRRRVEIPEVLGGGQGYTVPGNEKDVREGLNAAANIVKNINRLEKMVTTETILSPTTQALINQVAAESMGAWRIKLGLGVMSESDKELVKPLTGEFIGSFKSAAISDRLKILDNVKSLTRQAVDEYKNQLYRDPMATQKMQAPIRTREAQ